MVVSDRRNALDNHKGAVETLLQEIESQVSEWAHLFFPQFNASLCAVRVCGL